MHRTPRLRGRGPPVGERDSWADAALIIVIDDPALGGRPGAHAVASGWWRYLVETRGLRARRVRLLRNEEARVRVIEAAVESDHDHAIRRTRRLPKNDRFRLTTAKMRHHRSPEAP